MNRHRVLDLSLLMLTGLLTFTPLAITNLTYNVEAVKTLVFQTGTAAFLLAMALRSGLVFGAGHGLDYTVVAYFGVNFLAFLRSGVKEPGLEQLQVLTYQVLFYLLVRSSRLEGRRFEWLANCWLGAAFAAAAVAIVQVVGEYPVRFGVPWDTRATGTFLQPTFLGAYLSATLPLAVARAFRSRRTGLLLLNGAVVVTLVVGLGFSLSRSGWLGAVVGLAMLAAVQGQMETLRRAMLPLVAGVFLATWIALLWRHPSALDMARLDLHGSRSNRERFEIWLGGMRMIAARPLLGFGPGNFATYYPRYWTEFFQEVNAVEGQRPMHAHSEPLQVAVETGLAGLAIWLALGGWAARSLLRAAEAARVDDESAGSAPGNERELAQVHVAILAAVLANACVGLDQRFATSSMLFWYVLGIAASRHRPSEIEAPQGAPVMPAQRKPLLVAIAVYLIWLPVRDFRADHAKMLGASFHYLSNPRMAEVFLAQAAELRPSDSEVFFLQGRNYAGVNDLRRAEESYMEARRLDPNNSALLYNLAKVYTKVGLAKQAKQLLWEALDINPRFELAAQELWRLENQTREL